MADEEKDALEDVIEGTGERRIEIVRVGERVSATGTIKTSEQEDRFTKGGVLERISRVTIGLPDCNHVGIEIGGQCPVCHRYFCRACVERFGTCFVCGGVACPTCSVSTILDKEKRYHKACFGEAVLRKLLG